MNNIIRIYEKNETSFTHNGIKTLHPTSCIITRNLYDYTYELDMEHPIDDSNTWKEIIEGRIIKANGQYFRIFHTNTSIIDNSLTVYAKHIFFDLQNNFIEDTNVVAKNGNMALSQLLNATSFAHNFTSYSDISKVNNLRCVRKNVLDALLGESESFVSRWGGEFDADNFNIRIVNQVGKDNGYNILYGKNLIGLNSEIDYTEIVTRIRPVGFDGIELPDGNKYVDSPNINNYAMPIIKEYKYENVKWTGSPNYEANEEDDTSTIFDDLSLAQAELRRLASLEFTENEVDLPKVSCEINFIELSHTEEYSQFKNLQKVSLGDIITIYHKPLNINIKARCISYVYDCILDKYESITIGSYQRNFFKETASTNKKLEDNDFDFTEQFQSVYAQAISKMSNMMNNAMNGYVVLTNSEILIMDSPNKKDAKNVWKFNSSGIAHSSTGYEGEYTVGMTMDGHINGALITAGSIKADMLEAGTITTRELAVEIQTTINSAMTQETTQALITANIDGFKSELSKTYVTQENVTKQIENSTTEAIEQVLQNVDNQFDDYTENTLNPYLKTAIDETFQNSKDYVTQVTGNYYTKSEVDSSISQTRDEIQLHLSESYETKTNTELKISEAINGVNVGAINRVFGTAEEKSHTFTGGTNEVWNVYDISPDISDKDVIVSFEYDFKGIIENGSSLKFQGQGISISNVITYYPMFHFIVGTKTETVDIKNQQFSFATRFDALQQDGKFRFRADGVTGTLTIRKAQVKVGNKITEWSIAPEDLEINANNFTVEQLKSYYTKEETISEISQTKEQIKLELSETFVTQEDVATKIKDASEDAVEQATKEIVDNAVSKSLESVDSQLSDKLIDYTTNTLIPSLDDALEDSKKYTTEIIEDYYTKEEVASAIELTKEQIQLGVSENYETKANVEIKINENINNLSIGGRNIILNSAPSSEKGTTKWGVYGNGQLSLVDETTAPDGKAIKWTATSDDVVGFYNESNTLPVEQGKKYSSSVYIKASRAMKMRVGCQKGGYKTVDVTTNWQKIINTFTANSSTYDSFCFYQADLNNTFKTGDVVYVHSVKLEEGDKPTSWTYAPEDISLSITNAKNDAIDYTNTIIADYYTKEETKSEITQTKESIELGVSQTYETKANVQAKINGVSTQITNELDDYTTNTLNPAITTAKNNVLQNSKNYTTEVIKDYYKKSEVDSKILQTKESIELDVSQLYETKEDSSIKITEAIDGVTVGAINRVFGTAEEKTVTFNGSSNDCWYPYDVSSDISDKDIIISFEYDLNATVENGSSLKFQSYYISTSNKATYLQSTKIIGSTSTQTINVKNQQYSFTTKFHAIKQSCKFGFRADGITGTFTIRKAQIKAGNKVTEWSIAPEDIESNANNYTIEQLKSYYTKTQTDSRINIAKEEINLGVSSIYETKANVTTVINDAKKYSDTKKNEAIKSANNTLNTTIKNYYTKTETDSKINIAKESIELGVSSKYETIANVSTKINAITVGGENLLLGTSTSKAIKGGNKENQCSNIYAFTDNDKHLCGLGGTDVTLSFEYSVSSGATGTFMIQTDGLYSSSLNETQGYWVNLTGTSINVSKNPSGKIIKTVNIGNPSSAGFKNVNLRMDNFNGTLTISKMKLERGNKATDWSPNPKDIETNANNYTSTQLKSYYTKEETNSAINVAKNEINLGVSSTYETKKEVENKIGNISIGGRNLIRASQDFVGDVSRIKGFWIDALFKKTTEDGFAVMTAYQSGYQSNNIRSVYSSFVPCKKGDVFTISVWFKVQDISLWDNRCPYIWEVYDSSGNRTEYQDVNVSADNSNKPVLINNNWIRLTSTHTVLYEHASKCAIRLTLFKNGTISFKQPQVERGNKATDWSPNPQDIEDNANNYTSTRLQSYYTKEETNSQINIAKDSIKSEVSNTYYTKNEISSSGTANLIKNGGFEKGLEYWRTNESPSFNLNQSWQNYDGKSLFMSTDNYADGIYQYFQTEIGKTYTYSFYAQCEHCEFTVGIENTHTQRVAVSPNRWIYYQGTFTATANSHIFMIYNFNQNTQGNIFIDNIMVNEGVVPAKYTTSYSEVYESIANNTSLINQTASTIRSEISSSFSSYYNKNETDNKIYNATSSVTQTINDLKIQFSQSGGYNLFKNSKFHGGNSFWGNQSHNSPSGGMGYMWYADQWGFPDREVNAIYYTLPVGKSNVEWGLAQNVETTIGKQYTISFYYAAHRCTSANIIVRRSDGSWLANQSFNPSNYRGGNSSANNWGRAIFTFTATESAHTINIVMNNCVDSSMQSYFWIAKPQCEEGSVATAWSPHPNEVMTGITTISENGITVSHSNVNTTSSMDASGFRITRTSDNKDIFNATNGNLTMEGILSTGSSGKRVVVSDSNYKVYDGNTQKAFFGLRSNDGYVSPMLSLSADSIGTTAYDGFSINMYKRNNNPSSSTVDYMDMSYLVSSMGDYSNLKIFGDGNIRIAPVKNLEISTNYYNGSYDNPNGYEYVIAKFTSVSSKYYNSRLEIDAIVNTDMSSNGQGLVLEDSRGGSWSSVTVYTNPSTGQRTFRPVTEQTGTIYNGTSNALWKVVYSANGTIQTSDRRYKAITDDTDIYDCFKMVKNTKLHNYVMLGKNKEKMTQIELAESALFNVGEESSVQIGVMAQDLLNYKCGKQIVVHENIEDDDGNVVDDIYSVNAYPFASAVMGGLQYEIKQREELSNIVLNLCQTVLDLQQRIEDLEEK